MIHYTNHTTCSVHSSGPDYSLFARLERRGLAETVVVVGVEEEEEPVAAGVLRWGVEVLLELLGDEVGGALLAFSWAVLVLVLIVLRFLVKRPPDLFSPFPLSLSLSLSLVPLSLVGVAVTAGAEMAAVEADAETAIYSLISGKVLR
jgi:voltage-gated potassium channel Kch